MKSFKKISLLTALFAFILSFTFTTSNAQVTPPQPETHILKGEVVGAQSQATLADAEITVVGQDVKTVSNQEGKFKLENLPAGEHTLKVKLDGYQTWEKSLTLNKDAKLTIKLAPEKE